LAALFKNNTQSGSEDLQVYWSSNKHLAGKDWDNFGDALVPELIQRISGNQVRWVARDTTVSNNAGTSKVFFAIGSILDQASTNNIVWGSGIMNSQKKLNASTFLAVRGPISYAKVLASGFQMKPIWGDPALLCPFYFPVPKKTQTEKIALVPHYVDYDAVKNKYANNTNVLVVDLTNPDLEEVIAQIATARMVYSSSLHGLIVAHAYGVKAKWVLFSDKLDGDDVKFNDYFMSVGIRLYKPLTESETLFEANFETDTVLPRLDLLQKVQLNLIHSCPFIKK